MISNKELNDGVILLTDHEPIEMYYDGQKSEFMDDSINKAVHYGNLIIGHWESFFNEPFNYSEFEQLAKIETGNHDPNIVNRLTVRDRIEMDKPKLKQILKDKFIEKQGITISGLNINNSKFSDLLNINVDLDLIDAICQIKGFVNNFDALKPNALTLSDLFEGKKFYYPSDIKDKVMGKWFSVYTKSQAQNEILNACEKLVEVLQTFQNHSIKIPAYGMMPPLLRDMLSNTELAVRKDLFCRPSFKHLQ